MITRKVDGFTILQSERLLDAGVMHGWFGVSLGNTMPRDTMTTSEKIAVEARWNQACQALQIDKTKLVKTTGLLQTDKVRMIEAHDAGKTVGKADGYVSVLAGVPILLRAADCMQIVAYDPSTKVLGLVHAGGRGVASHIIRNTVKLMAEQAAEPERMIVAIGPSIAPKHFVPTANVDGFTLSDIQDANPVEVDLPDGRVGYDIAGTALKEFVRLGVLPNNIETSDIDTFSSPEFYSWERDRIRAPEAALYRHGLFASIIV